MRLRTVLSFSVLGLAMAGTIPSAEAVALRDEGVEFPDGSVQTTAAEPAGWPVQERQNALIPDLATCSPWTPLYAVPAGSQLLIEWLSVEIRVSADLIIDVDLRTHDDVGSVEHAVTRLSDPVVIALNPFASQRWSSEVTLHSVGNQAVEFRACRNGEVGDSVILVSFSGRLFEVAP